MCQYVEQQTRQQSMAWNRTHSYTAQRLNNLNLVYVCASIYLIELQSLTNHVLNVCLWAINRTASRISPNRLAPSESFDWQMKSGQSDGLARAEQSGAERSSIYKYISINRALTS